MKSRRSAVRRSKTDARGLEGIAAASGRQVLDETASERAGEIAAPSNEVTAEKIARGGSYESRRE